MVKLLGAVVQHGHNVRIVVFVVVVERIEKHAQTVPAVRRTEYITVVVALRRGVPKSLE